jgi:hypothetical protein
MIKVLKKKAVEKQLGGFKIIKEYFNNDRYIVKAVKDGEIKYFEIFRA